MEKITILITDDHYLVREALRLLLDEDPRFFVAASTGSGEEAIEIAQQINPDIVLMDISLPGISGLETTKAMRGISSTVKILGMSMQAKPAYALKMIRNGANGYVTKNSSFEEMCKAIIQVHSNHTYLCDEIKDNIANISLSNDDPETQVSAISDREAEVIEFVKKGYSSKQIAECLKISKKTIEAHRYNIMRKLKLKNVAALVNHFN
ncbi:MAG: response regulator [Chitinophagaceae bacterium]